MWTAGHSRPPFSTREDRGGERRMKVGLAAIQQARSAEEDLAKELERVGERHKTDQEVYHLTRTLAEVSRRNARKISPFQQRYPGSGGTRQDEEDPGLLGRLREKGETLLESVTGPEGGGRSGLLEAAREKGA